MLMPFHSVVPCVVTMMRNLSLTVVRKRVYHFYEGDFVVEWAFNLFLQIPNPRKNQKYVA